jgi:hypothetical protein
VAGTESSVGGRMTVTTTRGGGGGHGARLGVGWRRGHGVRLRVGRGGHRVRLPGGGAGAGVIE